MSKTAKWLCAAFSAACLYGFVRLANDNMGATIVETGTDPATENIINKWQHHQNITSQEEEQLKNFYMKAQEKRHEQWIKDTKEQEEIGQDPFGGFNPVFF